MNADEAWASARRIESAFDEMDCRHLFKVAQEFSSSRRPGAIVELGAWKGRSTVILSTAAPRHTIRSVDIWAPFTDLSGRKAEASLHQWRDNLLMAGVHNAVPIQSRTVDAADQFIARSEPVGLLFIDADHRYEAVKADIEAWTPILVSRATVVFHDYLLLGTAGVRRAVDEFVARGILSLDELVHSGCGLAVCSFRG